MEEKKIIYQTFPRLFGNRNLSNIPGGSLLQNGTGKMNDYTDRALQAIRELGCNYIWFTGLIQHAQRTDYSAFGIPGGNPHVIKGEAGSPYAITDYYAVDPDLAVDVEKRMDEFDDLVERTHRNGLKMIIDFVPNHVARQYKSTLKPESVIDFGENDHAEFAFHPQNNFYYIPGHPFTPSFDLGYGGGAYVEMPAKATGNDCFHASPNVNDWYETVKLNYGIDYSDGSRHFDPIPDTWTKMLHILLYWSEKRIDGFRCDMAHMVPIEFWEWVIPLVKRQYPEIIFIAEIYTPALYREYLFRGHFDYLYDKVGLYDTLRAITAGHAPASAITSQWQALEGIQQRMVNFLENHDEQRVASEYFAEDAWKAIPALIVSAMMNVNPFMLYFGEELGEHGMDAEGFSGKDGRTSIFDYWGLDKIARWNNDGKWDNARLTQQECALRTLYAKILTDCNREKAIAKGAFFDLMYANYENDQFNPDKQYAFLRKEDGVLILVIVNFDRKEINSGVWIPNHAFDFLQIEPGEYETEELLSGKLDRRLITPEQRFSCSIGPHSGLIIKIKLLTPNREKNKKTKM